MKTTTSLRLNKDHLYSLSALAKRLGYLQSTGPGANRDGNVSAMMRAIAEQDFLQEALESADAAETIRTDQVMTNVADHAMSDVPRSARY